MTILPTTLPIVAAGSAGSQITEMTLPESLLMSLIGMGIVFFALIAIMALVKLQSAVVTQFGKATPSVESALPQAKPQGVPASGSLGELALYDVPDKTAALLMAIVADESKIPLNELRFISIKEAPPS